VFQYTDRRRWPLLAGAQPVREHPSGGTLNMVASAMVDYMDYDVGYYTTGFRRCR